MSWFRIVPKSGNRRYLEVPRGPVADDTFKNVKSISCWSTECKPKNVKQLVLEECHPVIFIKKCLGYHRLAYIMIQAIAQYLKLNAAFDVQVVERSRGLYVRFSSCGAECYDKKAILKNIFSKILHHDYLHCIFILAVSTDVFLAFRDQESCKTEYSLNVDSFAEKYGHSSEDIRREICNVCSRFPSGSMHMDILTMKTALEALLKNVRPDDELQFVHIDNALNHCLFFKRIYESLGEKSYCKESVISFLLSLGAIGKKYLMQKILEHQIACTLDKLQQITPGESANTFRELKGQVQNMYYIYHQKRKSPMRCNKRYAACGDWCGAYSPTELAAKVENPITFFSEITRGKLSDAAEKFVKQLPVERMVFRRSELHTWLPKSMRSHYDVDQALLYLTEAGYICAIKPIGQAFRPGKKANLFFLTKQNFFQIHSQHRN